MNIEVLTRFLDLVAEWRWIPATPMCKLGQREWSAAGDLPVEIRIDRWLERACVDCTRTVTARTVSHVYQHRSRSWTSTCGACRLTWNPVLRAWVKPARNHGQKTNPPQQSTQ